MEVQVLEALEDFLISISVTLMRSLGKLLFCGCVFKIIVITLDLRSRASGSSLHYARVVALCAEQVPYTHSASLLSH